MRAVDGVALCADLAVHGIPARAALHDPARNVTHRSSSERRPARLEAARSVDVWVRSPYRVVSGRDPLETGSIRVHRVDERGLR